MPSLNMQMGWGTGGQPGDGAVLGLVFFLLGGAQLTLLMALGKKGREGGGPVTWLLLPRLFMAITMVGSLETVLVLGLGFLLLGGAQLTLLMALGTLG